MAKHLDYQRLSGNWINLYDERDNTNNFLCCSAKFTQVDPVNTPNVLTFEQGNSIYEETRAALR